MHHLYTWQAQQAKARFSALMSAAQTYPQTVTVRGRPKSVVIAYDIYCRMVRSIGKLQELEKEMQEGQTGQNDIPLKDA